MGKKSRRQKQDKPAPLEHKLFEAKEVIVETPSTLSPTLMKIITHGASDASSSPVSAGSSPDAVIVQALRGLSESSTSVFSIA